MSRSVHGNLIDMSYPPKADFTIAEAEQCIAMCHAATGFSAQKTFAGNCMHASNAAFSVGRLIDVAKLETLAPVA